MDAALNLPSLCWNSLRARTFRKATPSLPAAPTSSSDSPASSAAGWLSPACSSLAAPLTSKLASPSPRAALARLSLVHASSTCHAGERLREATRYCSEIARAVRTVYAGQHPGRRALARVMDFGDCCLVVGVVLTIIAMWSVAAFGCEPQLILPAGLTVAQQRDHQADALESGVFDKEGMVVLVPGWVKTTCIFVSAFFAGGIMATEVGQTTVKLFL